MWIIMEEKEWESMGVQNMHRDMHDREQVLLVESKAR